MSTNLSAAGQPAPAAYVAAPAASATPATPWHRRAWVIAVGAALAVILAFWAGFATGAFTTSLRGPGDMSFEQGGPGQFPGGGPGDGELPDGFPGGGTGSGGSTGSDSGTGSTS